MACCTRAEGFVVVLVILSGRAEVNSVNDIIANENWLMITSWTSDGVQRWKCSGGRSCSTAPKPLDGHYMSRRE